MAFYLPDSQPHNCECDFILIMRRHLSKHSAAQLENIKIKTSPIFTGVRKQTCCPVCVCVGEGGELSMFGRRNHAGYGSVNAHVLLRRIWLWRKKKGFVIFLWMENGSVLDLWWGGDIQRAAEWLSLRLPIRSVNKPPDPVWWILSWCLIMCNANTSPLPDHALLWKTHQSLVE